MRNRLLLIALTWALVPVCAQIPGQGREAQHAGHNQEYAEGVNQPPADVPVNPSVSAQKDEGEGKQEKAAKKPGYWEEAFGAAYLANWFLVVVGGIAGYLAWRSLEVIRLQASEMKTQASLMSLQSRLMKRQTSIAKKQADIQARQVEIQLLGMNQWIEIVVKSVARYTSWLPTIDTGPHGELVFKLILENQTPWPIPLDSLTSVLIRHQGAPEEPLPSQKFYKTTLLPMREGAEGHTIEVRARLQETEVSPFEKGWLFMGFRGRLAFRNAANLRQTQVFRIFLQCGPQKVEVLSQRYYFEGQEKI